MSIQIKKTNGFSLVETLFYVAGVVLLLFLIITILFNGQNWYNTAIIYPRVNTDGSLIASRIGNDIRAGSSLNAGQNIFNATNGSIGINAKDASNNSVTYYYYIQNGRIAYQKNGGTIEYISPANFWVSKLQFNQIDTAVTTAVRFVVNIDYKTKTGTTTNTYSSVAIMRNLYK